MYASQFITQMCSFMLKSVKREHLEGVHKHPVEVRLVVADEMGAIEE